MINLIMRLIQYWMNKKYRTVGFGSTVFYILKSITYL